jgi:hypothetical protein
MNTFTIAAIIFVILTNTISFFIGALWSRSSMLKNQRLYRSFDPNQF